MLSRLLNLWNSQQINSSSEKQDQLCSALGDLGVFVFGSSSSLEKIKSQHEITSDEETFLHQFSQCESAKKVVLNFNSNNNNNSKTSSSLLYKELTQKSNGVFGTKNMNANKKKILEEILSYFTTATTSVILINSTPENLLEFFVYVLAVFNNNKDEVVTYDLLLVAFCCCFCTSQEEEDDDDTTLKIALLRTAATLAHSEQNPVLNSMKSDALSKIFPTLIRTFADVLEISNSSASSSNALRKQKDIFLRRVCAPTLSQFGFEFLWRHVSATFVKETFGDDDDDGGNESSSTSKNPNNSFQESDIVNLLHYCQLLTYSERLEILKIPNDLALHILPLDGISTNSNYFGGYGTTEEANDASNKVIPAFWKNAFRNIQKELFPSSILSSHYLGRGLNNNKLNDSDDVFGDSASNNSTTASSYLRRNRFAAKVASSSSSSSTKNSHQTTADRSWIEFYNLFISSKNSSSSIPNDVTNSICNALSLSNSNSNNGMMMNSSSSSSSLSFDPMMLATLFYTSTASLTTNGRLWMIEKLLAAKTDILSSSFAVQSMQPFWLLAPLLLADVASTTFLESDENEDSENPVKQKLFDASFVFTMLERLESLALYSSFSSSSFDLINVMKFDILICGFNNNNNNSSSIDRGATIFRNSFCRYGFVRNKFQKIIRLTWEKTMKNEQQESSSASMIQYKLSELTSLATMILSKILSRCSSTFSASTNNNNSSNNQQDAVLASMWDPEYNQDQQFILTSTIICEFLISEWEFAAKEAKRKNNNNSSSIKSFGGDLTSIVELCDGCLNRISSFTTASATTTGLEEYFENIKKIVSVA